MRKLFVLIHRYAGLAMTLFLIIVGLTGSVLAFYHELDCWLAPELLTVPVHDVPMLDPLTLRERAEALEPRARIDQVSLQQVPGESYSVWVQPKTDPATGKDYELPYGDLYLNPYTGEKIGTRKFGEVSLAKENVLSFLYRLHFSLALPESTGNLGGYVLGITALVWSLDCFVEFYLTLPSARRRRSQENSLSFREREGVGTNRYDPLQNKPGTWFTSVMVLARRKRQCRGKRPVLWINEFNFSVTGWMVSTPRPICVSFMGSVARRVTNGLGGTSGWGWAQGVVAGGQASSQCD